MPYEIKKRPSLGEIVDKREASAEKKVMMSPDSKGDLQDSLNDKSLAYSGSYAFRLIKNLPKNIFKICY